MQNNFSNTIRSASLHVFMQKLITPVITFLLTIFIVRHLSVDDYGVYNLLFALMAYIGLFSSLGLLNIFKRYIPEWLHDGQISYLRHLIWQGLKLRGLLVALFVLLTIVLAPQIGRLFQISYSTRLFAVFSLGILFFLESQLLGLALTSLFLHKYFSLAQVAYSLVRALLVLVMLKQGYGLQGLVMAEVLGFILLAILQYFFFHVKFVKVNPCQPAVNFPYSRLRRFGGFAYFNEMGEQVLDVSTDFFIISAFLGAQQVGLYAFATETIKFISRWMPHRILLDVITPTFYTRFAKNKQDEELQWMFTFLAKLVLFFFVPFVMLIILLGKSLILFVYDPKYLPAFTVMGIVVVFNALNAFEMPLGLVVQAKEKVEIHFQSKIFSIYNLIGNLLVVRDFGIVGIALVTSSAVLMKNIFTYQRISKHVDLVIPWMSLLKMMLNATLMGIPLLLLQNHITSLWFFVAVAILAAGFYLLLSFFNKPFTQNERDTVNRVMGRSLFRF